MKRIFTLLTFFIGILSVCTLSVTEGYAQLTGDNYPVQAHVYVQRPSLKMPEYFSSSTMLRTDLILKDLTKTTLDVYLGWQITGLGLGVEAGTLPGFVPPNYLTLTKGSKRQLSGAELREYFQPGMLAVSGVGENVIFNGKLPEGFYTIKITAYEAGTGRQVSNTAETFFSVAYALPPVINLPLIGSEQPVTRPQSVLLQWMPRHTATGSNRITYSGKVCEVAEDEDPNVAINGSQNCFTIPAQPGTSYVLKASDLPLKVGKRYAFQVQVTDNNEQLEFQNQGYSEVSWFRFGEACKAPSGLQVNAIAAGRSNVSWNANLQATGYKLLYRSKNETEWTEQTTLGTSVSLVSLNPELDYEFKVITICEVGNESPESETVTWEGEGEIDEELEDLIKKVLNPEGEPIVSTGPGIERAVPSDPLPETFEDLIPKDPTKIPCQSQLHSYEECSDVHPEGHIPTADEVLQTLKVGDLITIYDYLVVLTEVSGGNNIFSGKGLVKMPFLEDKKMPVEFSNVEIKRDKADQNGGCVTAVNGYFRVRTGLTPEQIRQEEIDLIHKVRTNTDPGSIYISRGQVITELGEELGTTGKDLCDGKPITEEAKQSLLKKHTLAKQGLQDWAEDAADLYSELDLDGTEILGRIQALITTLVANIPIINSGEGCPDNSDIKTEMDAIKEKIKEDIEKSKEPTDTLPKITDVVVKNITESEATITWKGDKRFTKYLVSYQTEGQGVVVKEVTKPTLLLSQLDKNKIYNFTIKGIAESSEHTFGPEEFTTLKSSFPPITNLTSTEIGDNLYKLTWDKNKEHASYKVIYQNEKGERFSVLTNLNTINLTDLSPNGQFIEVTAFNAKKTENTTARKGLSGKFVVENGGINEVYHIADDFMYQCYFTGTCEVKFGFEVPPVGNENTPGIGIREKQYDADRDSGRCKGLDDDTVPSNWFMIGFKWIIPPKINCPIISFPNPTILDLPFNPEKLDELLELEICEDIPESVTSDLSANMLAASNASSFTTYNNCIQSKCIRNKACKSGQIRYSFWCKMWCAIKCIYHQCNEPSDDKKPTVKEAIEKIVFPIPPKKSEECVVSKGYVKVLKCYLLELAAKSNDLPEGTAFIQNNNKEFESIGVKVAPNGDFYYGKEGAEFWKIDGKYTITKTKDNKWLVYNFSTNKWCYFTPDDFKLELEKEEKCDRPDVVKLKTNGVSPFIFKIKEDGIITEYPSESNEIVFDKLSAGEKTFLVEDIKGCKSNEINENIKASTQLGIELSKPSDCYTKVTVDGICGEKPYLYSKDGKNYSQNNVFSDLRGGETYTFYVKSANGAVESKSIKIPEREILYKYETPDTYKTYDGTYSKKKSNVCKPDDWRQVNKLNEYKLIRPIVKNGLVDSDNYSIADCNGGEFSFKLPYATFPATITVWSDNGYIETKTFESEDITFTNLPAGSYRMSGTEGGGCPLEMKLSSDNSFEILSYTLSLSASFKKINCNNSDYNVEISAYLSQDLLSTDPVILYINGKKEKTFDTWATLHNYNTVLKPGSHTIKLEDAKTGCSTEKNITIPNTSPLTLTGRVYTDSDENGACADDPSARVNLSLNVEGGLAPYSFSVSTATSSYSGNMSVFNNLENTNMTVSVIDKNKCTASFTYQPFDPMLVIPAAQNAACDANGKINVTVTGGNQPYQYSINNVDFQSSPDFENLEAGTYTVTVKDAFDCTASAETTIEREEYEISLSVTSENPTCGADGIIKMEAKGGRGTYQYSIDGGSTWRSNSTLDDLCPGTYGPFKVKDTGGCEATAESITLTAPEFIELVTPDGPPVVAVTDPQARTSADEDGVIIISYKGKEYRVKVPQHQKVPNSYNIIVNSKTYVPLFINCRDNFLGYYEKDCSSNPCTQSVVNDFEGIGCTGNVPLKWNGKKVCKECWLEDVEKEKYEKLIVTVRTFLPYNYVNDPLNGQFTTPPIYPSMPPIIYNQNIIDLANVRDYPQYRNIAAHGSYKTKQIFELDFKNKEWIYTSDRPYYSVPPTALLNKITNESNLLDNDENSDSGTAIISKKENKSIQVFKFQSKVSAGNPAFDPSPNIDYNLTFEVAEDGNYRIEGFWDGFPAIEIFIEDPKTGKVDLVFYKGTADARQTPTPRDILYLFPIYGDVQVNVMNNFGNKPHQDRSQPYPDVEEMKALFKTIFED